MSEIIITKICNKCKQAKPIDNFHKDRTKTNGLRTICKICSAFWQKEYAKTEISKQNHRCANKQYAQTKKFRQTQKRYRINNPEKRRARHAISYAIESGKLPYPNTKICSCGKQAEQYHHHKGYIKKHWLDVIPICIPCHISFL